METSREVTNCQPGPRARTKITSGTRRVLYSFAENVSSGDKERELLRAKIRPREKEPRMLAIHDPMMLDKAKSGLFLERLDTTTASCNQSHMNEYLTSSHSAPAVSRPMRTVGMPNRFATIAVESTKISADRSSSTSDMTKMTAMETPCNKRGSFDPSIGDSMTE